MIFVGTAAFGQQKIIIPAFKKTRDTVFHRGCFSNKFQRYYIQKKKDTVCSDKTIPVVMQLKGDYYSSRLGFFCKQEIKLEKATKIPFKFRLGSVQYCDWMEGKRD